MQDNESVAVLEPPCEEDVVTLDVHDVTGMCSAEVDIPASMSAGAVATMVAQELQLTSDVGWGLRDDYTSMYMDPKAPIHRQVGSGPAAKPVTLIPKAHLGSA